MDQKTIQEPTLRRLPLYHSFLMGVKSPYVSCTQIAAELGLVPIQVRKDLEATGLVGKPKVGYSVGELITTIESYLGWDCRTEAFLVGAGHMGAALLGYRGFKDYGLQIIGAFDNDPNKIGKIIGGKKVFAINRLTNLVQRTKVKIGILAVPAAVAQEIADLMVSAGIEAIWNFAPVKLKVSDNIIVQHENLASSLAVLSKKVNVRSFAK